MKYRKGDIVVVKFPFILKEHGEIPNDLTVEIDCRLKRLFGMNIA